MKLNIIAPRTGAAWMRAGLRTFWRQPLALTGLFFMYMATVVVLGQIPVVGMVLAGLLVPAATLGLMAASAEASEGRFPMPTILVSALRVGRQRLRAMLVLGAIYSACSLLAGLLSTLIAGTPGAMPVGDGRTPQQADLGTLLALLPHLPLVLMFWHAPALVHWHGVSPVKALFFSVVAVLRNFGAYLVFGLCWMGVLLAASGVVGLVAGMTLGAESAQGMMVPVALLMAAMVSTSIFFTFRDSFLPDDAPQAQEAAA